MSAETRPREGRLIEAFVGMADTLVADFDVIDLLDRLVAHCVDLLAAEAAGILLADARGGLLVVASTSEQSRWTELLQLHADEGPCVDCVRTGEPVSVADLDEMALRWPRFAAAMHRPQVVGPQSVGPQSFSPQSFSSVHALPLRLRGQAIGALNLFHRSPGPLPPTDLVLAQALADVATIGILQERALDHAEVLNAQLQTALNSRVIIEQAKGVLAQRGGLPMEDAFGRLRSYSRDNNLRLAEVARQVVETDVAGDVLAHRAAPRSGRRPR